MSEQTEKNRSRDIGFYVVSSMIIAVVVWILMTPFVPSVAKSTMERFHLKTKSFELWSLQQVVPSMYNFGNSVAVSNTPPGMIDEMAFEPLEPVDSERPRFVNHFPMRRLTFADARAQLFYRGEHKWLDMKSTYRGMEVQSRIHAKPIGGGEYEVIRMDEELAP